MSAGGDSPPLRLPALALTPAMQFFLYLALTLMGFHAAALTLSTGELSFAELEAPQAAATPNIYVLQIEVSKR